MPLENVNTCSNKDICAFTTLHTNICTVSVQPHINGIILLLFSFILSLLFCCRGEQVHILCAVEELMPSVGTVVPPPVVLASTVWQSESFFRNIDKQCQDLVQTQFSHFVTTDTNSDHNVYQGMTYLTSISEDGKIWSWLLSFDNSPHSNKANLGANLRSY
jgi:hypothetical protein